MGWLAWGVLLLLQNAAFTLVSRARTRGSLLYHGVASVASNGVWFLSQIFLFDYMLKAILVWDGWLLAQLFAFYTLCTVLGSVGMHYISMRYQEGKRAVGARG